MQLYAITDRRMFAGNERERCAALLSRAEAWARAGVGWVQVREKDLGKRELRELAGRLVGCVRRVGSGTRILVNGAAEVAVAAGADGVHLPGGDRELLGERVKAARATMGERAVVSAACHAAEEAEQARAAGASVVLFAPVFEKVLSGEGQALPGGGLDELQAACLAASPVPVFALGGVTAGNARQCMESGAAGVAGIRLFAGEGWRSLV